MVATEDRISAKRSALNETSKDGFVALIWEPAAALKQQSGIDSMLTPDKLNFVPSYPMVLQTKPSGLDENGLPLIENILLKPGANLDVPLNTWESISKQKMVSKMVEEGRIKVVAPLRKSDKNGNPLSEKYGYHHFNDDDAITLVKFTLHEIWVDDFSTSEDREVVVKAIGDQKRKLAEAKAKRML